jgi:hypothetical protein
MDPLTRKLFQPREAREKLRGMGGIMSSSPQLASTVAKFNVGGPIQAMPPQRSDLGGAMPLASAIHGPSGMMYGQMSLQQLLELANSGDRLAAEVLMMLQPPTGGTLPDETRARLDLVRDITDPDSSFGRQLDQFSARLADFGTQPRVAADLAGMDAPSIDAVPTIALDTAPAAPRQAPGAIPQIAADAGPSVTQSRLSPNRKMMTDNALDPRLDMVPGSALFKQQQQEVDDFNRRQRERDRVAQAQFDEGLSNDPYTFDEFGNIVTDADEIARIQYAQEQGLSYSGEISPTADRNPPGGIRRALEGIGEQYFPTGQTSGSDGGLIDDFLYKAVVGVDPITGTPTGPQLLPPAAADKTPVVDTTPPAPTLDVDLDDPDTYDTNFEEMMRRLGEATGKEDKSSRQKAMADLAMIGLAIAAGQSPDALTNIAQGALTGVKAIRAEDAATSAADRETRSLAARMASEATNLDREIASRERIARMNLEGRGDPYAKLLLEQTNALIGAGVDAADALSLAKLQLKELGLEPTATAAPIQMTAEERNDEIRRRIKVAQDAGDTKGVQALRDSIVQQKLSPSDFGL